jgi:hypothetical protein
MTDPTEIRRLQKAIRELYGFGRNHVGPVGVRETFKGEIVWDGAVELFELVRPPSATMAYAWSRETDGGGRRCIAVLGVPPINSAVDAVRAAVVSETKRREKDNA